MAGPGQNTDQNANQNAPQQGQNANNNTNDQTEEERRAEGRRRENSHLMQAALLNNRILPALNGATIEQRARNPQQNTAQNPRQAPAPKQKKSAWGNFKHGVFTALSALATFTVGGFFWLVSKPFIPTEYYSKEAQKVNTKTDTNIIPGTKNERFQDPDVDGGPDNQPVIDDVRRLPLVYEKEIFDDPDQQPTITLHFKQAKEGSSVAFSSKMKAGHAFLTLKYTRTDPLTGKNKRYQTTVGFGSQASRLTGGAELLNGMFVPGVINNELGAAADVSKEYTITNKALNKAILGIQKYAPGGYQLMKRNCTTFVAEMAKEAGLGEEVQQFMKEVDFETEASPVLPTIVPPLVLIGGPTATELGKYGAYKDVGKINYQYGQFGQFLYNKDEIERINKLELNARMYGYDPSSSAEALRNMAGTGLNSTAYGNGIVFGEIPRSANTGNDSNKALQFRFQVMQQRMNDAKRSLQAVLDKKCPGYSQNTELMNFLEDTTNLFRERVNGLFTPEILQQPKQRRELYISFWKDISERMNTLNDYYLNNYQGNPEVNIRFQHMSSLCANMKTLILRCEEVQKLKLQTTQYSEIDRNNGIADYVDMSKDSAQAVSRLFFSKFELDLPEGDTYNESLSSVRIPNAELAAGPKVFGSVKDCFRYHFLDTKPKRTKEEAKEYAKLSKRYQAMPQFVKAQESIVGKRQFTLHDYKYAFVDLPQSEKDSGLKFGGSGYTPAKNYQAIALERTFGGLKMKLADALKNGGCTFEDLQTMVCDHMAAKIEENQAEYLQLVHCLYLDEKHNYQKFDRSEDEQNFNEYCLEKANERILQSFHETYYSNIFTELHRTFPVEAKTLRLYNAQARPLQNLPQFQVVREKICKLTGIQPLLAEKRSAAIQTLKAWKEAEARKEQEAKNPAAAPAKRKRRGIEEEPEITPEKLKESVETLLKVDACYADLISSQKLPLTGSSAVTEETLNKIQVSINDNEVNSFAKKLLKCGSSKKPLAVSKEELQVVDMMKELKKLGKKPTLLEEEPGPNLI